MFERKGVRVTVGARSSALQEVGGEWAGSTAAVGGGGGATGGASI